MCGCCVFFFQNQNIFYANGVECCHEFGDDVGSHRVVLSIDPHKIKCSRRIFERTKAIATDRKTHKTTIPAAAHCELKCNSKQLNVNNFKFTIVHPFTHEFKWKCDNSCLCYNWPIGKIFKWKSTIIITIVIIIIIFIVINLLNTSKSSSDVQNVTAWRERNRVPLIKQQIFCYLRLSSFISQ